MLLGVDVGGTFTDAVLVLDGALVTAKAPTTHDQSEGVLAAIEAALHTAGRDATAITAFAHGMTVATNALLEGKGARTALIATEGFTDIVALGRQNRVDLYRLCADRPQPLVPDDLRFSARERMGPDGPITQLTGVSELAKQIAEANVESVAVVLLHSYRHPQHELAIARALPNSLHVSLSHEVVGTFREFERAATTEVDAALSPLLSGYLHKLSERARAAGLPEPSIMQSNGGLIELDEAAGHAALTVLSGPAGGAAGAAFIATQAGAPDALCLDMGGTSCDVCVVDGGAVQEHGGGEIAGRPLALPSLAIHTVGAGGGSIAWLDPGGALRVGPRSAGADPGPACYGRGGTEPTVTDAHVVLGHVHRLAGGITLDHDAAERAVASLGVTNAAEGIIRVANAEMIRALRVVTVERGIDPRRYALLAFGGAGPLHAAAIADELGIAHVLVPRASGVLAALGLVVAPQRRDVQRTVMLTDPTPEDIHEHIKDGDATYELRYAGQSHELAIKAEPTNLREEFEAEHERRYGYRDPGQPIELVTIRVTTTVPGAEVELTGTPEPPVHGPRVIELPESTLLVPDGWTATVDHTGTTHLKRMDGR